MWENMRFRSDRENAGVVAAAFVCTLAGVGLAAAVLLATRNSQGLMLSGGVLASGFVSAAIVLLVGRALAASERTNWFFLGTRNREESVDYEPRIRKSKRSSTGTQAPPTVADLREMKENTNTWVPSGKFPKRK